MNHEHSGAARSSVIPLVLLGVSLAAILVWQIVVTSHQRKGMYEAKRQLGDAIQKREDLVKQSNQLQAKIQTLVIDLLDLAKHDEKAKGIVQKYNIQQTAPVAPAVPPAPAATGTP